MFITQANGKRCAALSLAACALLFSAAPVQAQTFSELQNLAFYPGPLNSLDTESAAAAACTTCPDSTETVDMALFEEVSISNYLQNIAEIQRTAGSYAPELSEQLTSAGLLYQQQNLHEEAVSSFDRAAQSSRIQSGLYSSEQIVLAEHTINSLVALGRVDDAEDKYQHLLHIHQELYGPAAAQTAHALLGFGQWQVERLHHDLSHPATAQTLGGHESAELFFNGHEASNSRFDDLYQAQNHFVDAIHILMEHQAWSDPALIALEHNLVRTYYMDAFRAGVIDTPLSYAIDESSLSHRRALAKGMPVPEQYVKGAEAYRRMLGYLQKNPGATIAGVADVMLGLADWHLLFGKKADADAQYLQLEEFMAVAGAAPDEAAAILRPAVPVTLPAFHDSALSPKPMSDTSGTHGYVDVRFNVNRHGRATKLEVLGTSDGTATAVVDRLEKLVRNAQFRPATVASADVSLRYYFSY